MNFWVNQQHCLRTIYLKGDVFFSKKILVIIHENHFECGGPEINAKIHFSSYLIIFKTGSTDYESSLIVFPAFFEFVNCSQKRFWFVTLDAGMYFLS